jgi:hypothetical protein
MMKAPPMKRRPGVEKLQEVHEKMVLQERWG